MTGNVDQNPVRILHQHSALAIEQVARRSDNPVAGGILAAKAMIPSIGLLLSKYGLKQVGETLDERNLAGRIRQAEKQVLAEFNGASATQVVEPLLAQLDKAIHSDVFEYDPLLEVDDAEPPDSEDSKALESRHLAILAIVNTYSEVLENTRQHERAGLGPEDIRWLRYLRTIANSQ